eukprot:GFUD01077894.1.p1 GENE.GFUD01077894.1~~GFUD01077894.1.p1  ORF type:complete len:102 (+),score=7.93 GFUD01077894.1:55-360(+)
MPIFLDQNSKSLCRAKLKMDTLQKSKIIVIKAFTSSIKQGSRRRTGKNRTHGHNYWLIIFMSKTKSQPLKASLHFTFTGLSWNLFIAPDPARYLPDQAFQE